MTAFAFTNPNHFTVGCPRCYSIVPGHNSHFCDVLQDFGGLGSQHQVPPQAQQNPWPDQRETVSVLEGKVAELQRRLDAERVILRAVQRDAEGTERVLREEVEFWKQEHRRLAPKEHARLVEARDKNWRHR